MDHGKKWLMSKALPELPSKSPELERQFTRLFQKVSTNLEVASNKVLDVKLLYPKSQDFVKVLTRVYYKYRKPAFCRSLPGKISRY